MRISQVEYFSKRGKTFARAYVIGANSNKVPMPAREFTDSKEVEKYLQALTEARSTHEALANIRGM